MVETEVCAARSDRLGSVECDRPLHFAMFVGANVPRLLETEETFGTQPNATGEFTVWCRQQSRTSR